MIVSLVALLVFAAQVQPAPSDKQFDAAILKHSTAPAGTWPSVERFPARISIRNTTLSGYVQLAYNVRASQVSGPGRLSDATYDLEAKCDKPWTPAEFHVLLQHFLRDEIHLVVRHEAKQESGYVLTAGPRAKELLERGDLLRPQSVAAGAYESRHFENMTMTELAFYLSEEIDAPVVNGTSLDGAYRFALTWTSGPMRIRSRTGLINWTVDRPGPTLFDAVKDIGLVLAKAEVSVDHIVIDHVDQ